VLVQVITRIEEEKKQAMRKMGEEKKNWNKFQMQEN
jgi:hypothetical protein